MPKTLSIHGLDASTAKLLAAALRSSAEAKTKSGNGLRRFRGCVSSHDADAALEFVSNTDFSQVDEEGET